MHEFDILTAECEVLRRTTLSITEANGRKWAVKTLGPNRPPVALFCEYVVGRLARQLGLRWPEVGIAGIDSAATKQRLPEWSVLPDNGATDRQFVVSIEWLNITPIHPHAREAARCLSEEESPESAKQLILDDNREVKERVWSYLDDDENLHQLCGFEIFSRWAYASDTKNDVVLADASNKLWFLDGEYYLGNSIHIPLTVPVAQITSATCRVQRAEFFPFTAGLRRKFAISSFDPWLERLLHPDFQSCFEDALKEIPAHWKPPSSKLEHIRQRLFTDAPSFVETYRADHAKYFTAAPEPKK